MVNLFRTLDSWVAILLGGEFLGQALEVSVENNYCLTIWVGGRELMKEG